ncbi:reverse transcriptase domain-containing protein [Tanacetum coccineum]
MTRSSTSKLFTPYKQLEREFRSSRRHFKTLSLDELRSPNFNLFSDQEYSEEEVVETMAETMEQYMSKTRADYGSGVARPKIEDKDNFELKGQFLKELPFPMSITRAVSRWLRNEPTGSITTWDGLKTKILNKYCPPALTAKKMEEINNFQQEPDENLYQAWERFKELLMKCPQHYLTKMQETAANAKIAIQEMAKYSQKWHNGTSRSRSTETSDGLEAIQAQLNNLGREIKKVNEKVYAAQVGCEQCKGPHYTKDCPLKEEAVSCPIRRIGSSQYAVSTRQNRTLMYETRQMTIPFLSRLNGYYCELKKGSYGPQFLEAYSEASHINNSIPRKEKDPESFTLYCFINNVFFDNALVDLGASVSVMPLSTYLNLGLGELAHTKLTVELADKTMKYPKGIAENVLVGISIELNDLNEPFKIKRNQGDDLMPTIQEGELIKEFRTRDDELDAGIDDYPSYCYYDKKIHIDCAHNLKFSCMIGFEFTHGNFFLLLYVNVMSKTFHNSIMKDKMVYKRNNLIGALMNVPIFVRTFPVVTDFAVLENMDAYHDEVMGDVIFGEPFLREVGIKTRRFEGMITIYNGNDEVTYQIVQSHPRFKHYTNEQCNKIPTLLKVSDEDKKNEISHPYQKLKGFYKGVLNLGPEYVRDAKMEEWLTCGHISVHEMEW